MKGYRTFIFAIVLALLGVVEQYVGLFGDYAGLVLAVAGAVAAWLRLQTNTAPFKDGKS